MMKDSDFSLSVEEMNPAAVMDWTAPQNLLLIDKNLTTCNMCIVVGKFGIFPAQYMFSECLVYSRKKIFHNFFPKNSCFNFLKLQFGML